MPRIEHRFAALAREARPALVMYLAAGDPDLPMSLDLLHALVDAGVDLIELCYPFSDPILDGPVIQQANRRALSGGGSLSATLELLGRFRARDQATPIVLMGYHHPLVAMGLDRFVDEASAAGADGLIVADLPLAHAREEILPRLAGTPLRLIPLSAPMLTPAEIVAPMPEHGGFIYCIAAAGPTGGAAPTTEAVAAEVARCRAMSSLPVVVGFGIKTPEDAARVARYADGVVVATALVDTIACWIAEGVRPAALPQRVADYVAGFRGILSRAS